MKKAKRFINQINRYSLAHLRTGHYSKIARFALNKTRALLFGYPHHLMVEPTLECNIKCPLCPTPQSRNPRRFLYGSMPIETFRKIIDNSKDVVFKIHLTTFGEPLLNEDLHLMIRYLTDHGIISMISTNATLLTKNKVEQLIDAGLDYLLISFDGFSPKSYESFRVGANFKKTLANIDTLNHVKLSKRVVKPYVDVQWIRNRLNENEIGLGRKYFDGMKAINEFHVKSLSLNEHIMPWKKVQDLGKRFLPQKGKIRSQYLDHKTQSKAKDCSDLLSPVVMANGDVTICCMDFKGEYVVGNILEKRFKELWNSSGYRSIREKGNHFRLPICQRCPARFR